MAAERILVTDAEERAVLAVCRGLAEAGYAVSAVAGSTPAAGHWSRRVSRRYALPNPRFDSAGFTAGLAGIAAEGEHAALVLGVDAAALAVSERRELFEPYLEVGLPPHDVVLRCLDKPAFLIAAETAGLAPPPSATCESVDAAVAAAERLGYPVVVKPTRSLERTGARMLTTRYADDERSVRDAIRDLGGRATVQRCVDGPVLSVSGVVQDGALLGVCVSRYARMWPPRGGSASASVTIDPPPDLVDKVGRLLADLGWQGIFELELLDGPDGPAAIDFNPRPYGSLSLAVAAGANLPALWVDALLGRRAETPAVARPGVHYRWEETEILNAFAAAAQGRLRTAARIAAPHRGTTHAFFRASDPAPLAARLIVVARSRLRPRRVSR